MRKRRGLNRHRWTKAENALLGTTPDAQAAKRLGLGLRAVKARRAKLGKAPACPLRFWTRQEDAILGTRADRAVAELLRRPSPGVAARRQKLGIPPFARAESSGVRWRGRNAPAQKRL